MDRARSLASEEGVKALLASRDGLQNPPSPMLPHERMGLRHLWPYLEQAQETENLAGYPRALVGAW